MKTQMILLVSQYLLLVHLHWSSSVPAPSQRLSVVDWTDYNSYEPRGRGTYAFGYDIEDPETDNVQFRDEERHENGTVVGSYGYVKPDGSAHIVRYVADENGYRATVEDTVGQPRYYGYPSEAKPVQSTPSSILSTALKSQNAYRKQKIHEQRLRPVDSLPQNTRYNSFPKRNDVQQTQDDYMRRNYFTNPEKYYIRY